MAQILIEVPAEEGTEKTVLVVFLYGKITADGSMTAVVDRFTGTARTYNDKGVQGLTRRSLMTDVVRNSRDLESTTHHYVSLVRTAVTRRKARIVEQDDASSRIFELTPI